MKTLEQELAELRKEDEYVFETDEFTDSILQREIVRSPQKGDKAIDFNLPNENGEYLSLDDLLAKGPCILSFVKGEWCHFCNLELKALERWQPEFNKYNATLVAISPHTVPLSKQMKEDKALSYSVLSDAGNEIAYQYGLRFKMQQPLMDFFATFGDEGMEEDHGDQGENTNTLPIPGTFVVAQDKTIIFDFVDVDHTKRAEPAEIVAALISNS